MLRAARAARAAVERAVDFHAVADDPALAVAAGRRERVDRAFETVEDVRGSGLHDGECLVVIVTANFTPGHGALSCQGLLLPHSTGATRAAFGDDTGSRRSAT